MSAETNHRFLQTRKEPLWFRAAKGAFAAACIVGVALAFGYGIGVGMRPAAPARPLTAAAPTRPTDEAAQPVSQTNRLHVAAVEPVGTESAADISALSVEVDKFGDGSIEVGVDGGDVPVQGYSGRGFQTLTPPDEPVLKIAPPPHDAADGDYPSPPPDDFDRRMACRAARDNQQVASEPARLARRPRRG